MKWDVEEISVLDNALKDKVDVIYFGDSAVKNPATEDNDKSTTVEMLKKKMPEYKILDLARPAYDVDLFYAYCKHIAKEKNKPKLVIVPINLRSFSPEWDMKPQYQWGKEKFFLESDYIWRIFYKPLAVLKVINLNTVSKSDYLSAPVYNGNSQIGHIKDFDNYDYRLKTPEQVKNKFIFHYMYSLSDNHRKIKSLISLSRLLKENNIQVIFYITPIDYESGKKYLGDQFINRIKDNTSLVCSVLKENGENCFDWSMSIKANDFNYDINTETYPNEHLREDGRLLIAEELSKIIKDKKL